MIAIDSRVGSSFTSVRGRHFDFVKALSERTNGNVETVCLDSGDFAFEGSGPTGPVYIGIERKALGDALGSMRSSRYAGDQAKSMSIAYDLCYLIVEGVFRPSDSGTLETLSMERGKVGWKPFTLAAKGPQAKQMWQYSELDKHIVSMENKKNVIMVRSGSPIETVWQIVNRYQWWQKPWDSHKSCDPIKLQTDIRFEDVSLLRDMASRIPGIGWEKSKLVDKHFGTVENMANALSSEWRQAGFGEKLAVRLYGLMRGLTK